MKPWLFTFFFALCTACVRYNPPPIQTPEAQSWKETREPEVLVTACPDEEVSKKQGQIRTWWTVYDDPVLDTLIQKAIDSSPTLEIALERLVESEALYGIALSELFPHIDLSVGARRQRLSQTQPIASGALQQASQSTSPFTARSSDTEMLTESTATSLSDFCVICPQPDPAPCDCPAPEMPKMPKPPNPPKPPKAPKPPRQPRHLSTLFVIPEVSYELDLWGKNYQGMRAAKMTMLAQTEALNTALLLLTTDVARAYLELRATDKELDVLEQNRQSRQNALDIQTSRFDAGLIDNLDVQRAIVQLRSVEADFENTKRFRRQIENLLARLVGESAPLFTLDKTDSGSFVPNIQAPIPSTVLENRPDIREAHHQIEAARYNVGVQKTAYFPSIFLTGNYGYLSDKTNNLFKWRSHVWALTADALTPIFNAGQISSSVKQAVSQYQQSVSNYTERVLIAFQEVEDAISAVHYKKEQLIYVHEQVIAARKTFELSSTQYDMGLIDYLNVVDAERGMLEAEREEVRVTKDQYITTIALIKALGGVWE
jgi:outer membrane protein, multidrug efflux system